MHTFENQGGGPGGGVAQICIFVTKFFENLPGGNISTPALLRASMIITVTQMCEI